MQKEDPAVKATEQITVPSNTIATVFRLTHTVWYFTIHGRTVRDKQIILLDMETAHFSRRALIVGMSTAAHGQYVQVANCRLTVILLIF